MTTFPPKKIKCNSDSNELILVDTVKSGKGKEAFFIYSYEISKTKMGSELPISETELKKYIDNKIFIAI